MDLIATFGVLGDNLAVPEGRPLPGLGKGRKWRKTLAQMAKNDPKLPISVISSQPIAPSWPLGEHGQRLWDEIQREYAIRDAGGLAVLAQLCAALDRAEELGAAIDRDGVLVASGKDGDGPLKAHPAVREELACRSFVVRSLERLGISISVEPRRGPGRPPRAW